MGLIEAGGYLSTAGSALKGYAKDGPIGALEAGGASAMINVVNKAYAGWLFKGGSPSGISAISGVLDQASEAVQQEAAACVGH